MRSAPATARLTFGDLPVEVIERILTFLPLRALLSANATARLFRGTRAHGRSPVEHALHVRARRRGHTRALPVATPAGACTYTEELFARERVLQLARAHAHLAACGGDDEYWSRSLSAFVGDRGELCACGEELVYHDEGEPTEELQPPAALGLPARPAARVPTPAPSLSEVRVCAVAAGRSHVLALSATGIVHACGGNYNGELGVGDTRDRADFTPLAALRGDVIVAIAAGDAHSVAIGAAGYAYSWGCNDFGQLGLGRCEGEEEEEEGDDGVSSLGDQRTPRRIRALAGVRLGAASAGSTHSLLLGTAGSVFACGQGLFGRLGHGDHRQQRAPRRVEALAGVRAVHVSAGDAHSLVVDGAGAVHAFGHGRCGCLGLGDESSRLTPKRVEALSAVRAVRASAGFYISAVLGADGSVYTFGANDCGELGLGDSAPRRTPERVSALADARVVGCALGRCHALFVTAADGVYSCGAQTAALGHDVSVAADLPHLPTPTRVHLPGREAC